MGKVSYQVCVCLLTKDETDYLYEWLDWHIAAGVEHFFIYDNSDSASVLHGLRPEDQAHCTVVDFSGHQGNIQTRAYDDCLNQFGGLTEWMAFIDTDEFIRVVDGTDLRVFLRNFADVDAIAARWVVYNADGQLYKCDRPVRERFRQVAEYPANLPRCKCIVRPNRVRWMLPHYPVGNDKDFSVVNGAHQFVGCPTDLTITDEVIAIDHYFTRSYEEWREKLVRGSCDPCCIRDDWWFEQMNPGLLEKAGDAV